jgi:hypothetical protein
MVKKLQRYKSLFLLEFMDRPAYAYTLYQAAQQALLLGYGEISALEFGVAGGNSLVSLEKHAKILTDKLGIKFQIYGFDTISGLPALTDYRDLMQNWQQGFFKMDYDKLRARLNNAKLVLGDIKETVVDFYQKYSPAPIGAIMFDVDLYHSTQYALDIFNTDNKNILPRVRCYFDDVLGNEISLTNEYTGEPLAIAEYNAQHEKRKITNVHHLLAKTIRRKWYPKCFVHHAFDHPQYTQFIAKPNQDMPLL